jgi:hypothetical protein
LNTNFKIILIPDLDNPFAIDEIDPVKAAFEA